MKKLVKSSLEELALEMPVLTELEQMAFIGGDKYIFDENGSLVNTIPMDHDYFAVQNEDFEEVGSIAIEGGIEKNKDWTTGSMFSGEGIGVDVFKFMADNTKVEWALSTSGNSYGVLTTSERTNSVEHRGQAGFDSFYHSHPGWGDYDKASEDDLRSAEDLKKLGYTNFQIYAPKREKFYSYGN